MAAIQKILLDILQLSKDNEEIALGELCKRNNISLNQIRTIIRNIDEFFLKNSSTLKITKKLKRELIIKAIEANIEMDRLIEALYWRDFESLCLIVLDYHEFHSIQNFHFTQNKKRYEIDVLSIREPLIFAIDAKKWKTGHAGALKTVVKNQAARVQALSAYLYNPSHNQKLRLTNKKSARIIPLIVTSKTYELQIFEGVPIIPYFKLNNFIIDYHRYLGILQEVPIRLQIQRKLLSFKKGYFLPTD